MSDEIVKFQIQVNDKALRKQIEELADPSTMLAIQNLFAKTIDPWVPFLEGPLSQTLHITPEYVQYRVPYAHYQYYGDGFNHTTDYHPLATERWDKVAMQTELDSFMEGVKRILEQRAREIYG
jgi:hypothetical protein